MRDTIHRTVIQIEVLSDGPRYSTAATMTPLTWTINYLITEGDCSGGTSISLTEVVPPNKVREALERIGKRRFLLLGLAPRRHRKRGGRAMPKFLVSVPFSLHVNVEPDDADSITEGMVEEALMEQYGKYAEIDVRNGGGNHEVLDVEREE